MQKRKFQETTKVLRKKQTEYLQNRKFKANYLGLFQRRYYSKASGDNQFAGTNPKCRSRKRMSKGKDKWKQELVT